MEKEDEGTMIERSSSYFFYCVAITMRRREGPWPSLSFSFVD